MALSPEKYKQLREDCIALKIGNEAIRESYEKGIHMTKARIRKQEMDCLHGTKTKPGVSMWVLMFMTRRPADTI